VILARHYNKYQIPITWRCLEAMVSVQSSGGRLYLIPNGVLHDDPTADHSALTGEVALGADLIPVRVSENVDTVSDGQWSWKCGYCGQLQRQNQSE
jgi:hypothetical protein